MRSFVKLEEARHLTPPVAQPHEWHAQMRAAVISSLTPADVKGIVEGMVTKAKGGDVGAAKFLLGTVGGIPSRSEQTIRVERERASGPGGADEIECSDGHPFWFPSPHAPGSIEHRKLLAARVAAGLPTHHPQDRDFS